MLLESYICFCTYIGTMEKTMAATGVKKDNGKQNGSYYRDCKLGLYRDNGKENGNYYIIMLCILGL